MRRTLLATTFTIGALVLLGGVVRADETQGRKPDATVRFQGGSVGLGVGTSWGSGTLEFHGKSYPIRVQGLTLGSVGATRFDATGAVFNLTRVEDVNGTYTGVGAGATAGGGASATVMRNQNGVQMEVTSTSQGAKVSAGVNGVTIRLAEKGSSD